MPHATTAAPSSALGSVACAIFIAVCAPVYTTLAWGVLLLDPESVDPGAAPLVVVLGGAVLLVGGLAILQQHRTRRAPAWWSLWATAVVGLAALAIVDPQLRQLVALSMVVAPMYTAMFMGPRAATAQLLLTAVAAGALSASTGGAVELRAVRAGCSVAVVVIIVVGLMVLRARLDAALARADHLALHDPLTGLLNRRGLREGFPALAEAARRSGAAVCLVLADLDHFKAVNDTHGHGAGDQLLVDAAGAVRAAARPDDLVVRLGGEELLLVALVVAPADVAVLAERIRREVAALPSSPAVTASVGAVGARPGADPEELLSRMLVRADDLMYRAKAAGRDRTVVEPQLVATGARPPTPASDPGGAGRGGGGQARSAR